MNSNDLNNLYLKFKDNKINDICLKEQISCIIKLSKYDNEKTLEIIEMYMDRYITNIQFIEFVNKFFAKQNKTDNMTNFIEVLSNNFLESSDLFKNEAKLRIIDLVSQYDIVKSLKLLQLLKFDNNNRSFLSLALRVYAKNNLLDTAIQIYKSIPKELMKKKFPIIIYEELCKQDKKNGFYFLKTEIYGKYSINEEDIIKCFSMDNMEDLLVIMSDNEIIPKEIKFEGSIVNLNLNICPNCNNKLDKFKLSNNDVNLLKKLIIQVYSKEVNKNLIQKFNDSIQDLEKELDKDDYNVIIDGNNILFFHDRQVNLNSFERLNIIYNKIVDLSYKPFVIIHIRHKNNLKKILGKSHNIAKNILKQIKIFYTPYNMNDDWFFLRAWLYKENSYLLTNDELKDHFFKINNDSSNITCNILKKLFENYILKYRYENRSYKVSEIFDYSIKIQKNDGIWHIPLTNDLSTKWLCMNKLNN